MFDLNNIDFIKTDQQHGRRNYSFVGIQRSKESDRLEFWLPLGFDNFNENDFNQVKGFFFKMYRTFKNYLVKKQSQMESEDMTIDRDGIIENDKGFSFINENKEQTVFYGKLNSLEKILEGFDELRISSLEKKQIRSHEIDYSRIHKYMHQAIYLEEDVIYLDEMSIAKNILVKNSPPILQLFCFIYVEIKTELGELDSVNDRAAELSEQFKENFLQQDSSLFGENTFSDTLNILKETLEDIDTQTTYKDEDYWHFFEAVEAFLYGERQEDNEDIYWGFSSFYDIWEDMCQTYVLENKDNTYYKKEFAFFADINGDLVNLQNLQNNPFELKLNRIERPRYLKPDLVIINQDPEIDFHTFFEKLYDISSTQVQSKNGNTRKEYILALRANDYKDIDELKKDLIKSYNQNPADWKRYTNVREIDFDDPDKGYKLKYKIFTALCKKPVSDLLSRKPVILENLSFVIVDYKYMRVWDYERYSPFYIDEKSENKVKEDIHKQLVYEWTVQQNFTNPKTESEFWIPFYSQDPKVFREEQAITNTHFSKSKIKLIKINFNKLQEFYIK